MMSSKVASTSAKLENPGVKLDTSRVGQKFHFLENARVGETIRFSYDGGSNPGGIRTVLVQAVEGEGVKGATLERDGAFRSYLDRHRTGMMEVVAPFTKDIASVPAVAPSPAKVVGGLVENRVRFDAAKSALLAVLTAEQLAALYQQHVAKDSKGVSYDSAKGELVVKTTPPPASFDTERRSASRFTVKNGDGKRKAEIFLYSGNMIGVDGYGISFTSSVSVTPAKLLEILQEVLAEPVPF